MILFIKIVRLSETTKMTKILDTHQGYKFILLPDQKSDSFIRS